MHFLSRRLPFLLLGLVTLGCSASPQEVPLTLTPGQRFEMIHETQETVIQTSPVSTEQRTQRQRFRYELEVLSSGPEGISLRQDIRGVVVETSAGGTHVVFDSDSGQSPPPEARSFAALIGHGVTLNLDARGRFVSVDGADALFDAVFQELQAGLSGATLELVRTTLVRKVVHEGVSWYSGALPDAGASGSWNHEDLLKTYMTVLDTRWSWSGDRKLKGAVKASPQKNPEPHPMGVINVTFEMNGTGEAELTLDPTTGWLGEGTLNWSMEGAMISTQSDGDTWPVTVTTESHFTCRPL